MAHSQAQPDSAHGLVHRPTAWAGNAGNREATIHAQGDHAAVGHFLDTFCADSAELIQRGYSDADIAKLWGGNFMRVWDQVQKAAKPALISRQDTAKP